MKTKKIDIGLDQQLGAEIAALRKKNARLTREVDRQKQTVEVLKGQKDFLNTLLETISNPVFYKDTQGKYTGCNKAFEDFIGRSRSEIIGKSVYEMAPKHIADKYHEKDAELFTKPGKQHYEWKVKRYDGLMRDVIFEKATINDAAGNVTGIVGVISDITERKNAEERLQEREETLSAILAASPVGIFLANNRILGWANQAMHRIWGYEEDALVGKNTRVLYSDDDEYERIGREFYAEIEKKGIGRIETRWLTGDNEQIHCYLQGCPLDPSDHSKGLIVVAIDITERKRIEEEIRRLKEKYEDLYHNSPTMNLSLDPDGTVVECNNTIVDKLGYKREEFLGRPLAAFLTEDSVASMMEDFPKLLVKGEHLGVDRQLVAKDGEIIDVILSVTLEYDIHGNPKKTRAVFEDISERKQAEDLVHDLTQMLMQAQEHERKMISYELHDCIAQNLSILKINCDTLFDNQRSIADELQAKMGKLSELIEQTIQTVRELSYGLSPPGIDDIGIVKVIARHCEEVSKKSGLHIDFVTAGMDGVLPSHNTAINIYRLIQEGLTNTWKHADARHVTVKLIAVHPNIILQIEDDGKGFDVEVRERELSGERRMGLRIMQERVNLLHGRLTIRSRPAQGTRLLVEIPLVEAIRTTEKMGGSRH